MIANILGFCMVACFVVGMLIFSVGMGTATMRQNFDRGIDTALFGLGVFTCGGGTFLMLAAVTGGLGL